MTSREHKMAFDDALAAFKQADAFVTTILERIGRTENQLQKARADVEAIDREITLLGKDDNGDFEKQMRSVGDVSARKVNAETTVKVFQQTLTNLSGDLADAKVKVAFAELACIDAQREYFIAHRDEQLADFLESNRERLLDLVGIAHRANIWSQQPQDTFEAANELLSVSPQSFAQVILPNVLRDFFERIAVKIDPNVTRKDQPPSAPIRSAHIAGVQRSHLRLAVQFNERQESEIRKAVTFVPIEPTGPNRFECARHIRELDHRIEEFDARVKAAENRSASQPGDQKALADLEEARLDYERAVASRARWQETLATAA